MEDPSKPDPGKKPSPKEDGGAGMGDKQEDKSKSPGVDKPETHTPPGGIPPTGTKLENQAPPEGTSKKAPDYSVVIEKELVEIMAGKKRPGDGRASDGEGHAAPSEPLFDVENRLIAEEGSECEIPDFDNFLERFTKGRCAVVCGTNHSHVQWAATRLALNGGFGGCFRSTCTATTNLTFPQLINRISRRADPTCVVLNYFAPDDGRLFVLSHQRLEDALTEARKGRFGLILYLRSSVVASVIKQGRGWPDNIPVLELRENRSDLDHGLEPIPPAEFYQRLSAGGGHTLTSVLAAEPETYLPRTLARVAVLFPDLPVAYFEQLLRAIMATRSTPLVSLPKEGEKAGVEYQAVSVWEAGKIAFERQTGLLRTTTEAAPRMSFGSPELTEAAANWAWQDPEAMFEMFSAVSQLNILFDDDSESGDRELFDAYISAGAQLARRTPITFGNRWLKSLFVEYNAWVRQRTGGDIPAQEDLLGLLKAIAQSEERRKLWRHFSTRFGVLARRLMLDGSGPLVERFLDQLARLSLRGLAVSIVQELAQALGSKRFERLVRLVNEGGHDVQEALVWQFAYEVCQEPGAAGLVWESMTGWLPVAGAPIKSPSEEVAVALPAAILDVMERRMTKVAPSDINLSELLDVTLKSGRRIGEVWTEILSRPEFGSLAADCTFAEEVIESVPESDRATLGVSRVFFQMALVLPDAERERVHAAARTVLAAAKSPVRTRIKFWWQHLADLCAGQREELPIGAEHDAQRKYYLRNYRICRELTRL